jgi:hypothetical protein
MLPSVLAVANVEGVHNRTTQTLFEGILLPQRSPRSYIAVIAIPLILHPTGDVHTSPPKCPLQGRRAHVSPNFPHARETCIRPPQLFSFKRDVNTSPSTFPTQGRRAHVSSNALNSPYYTTCRSGRVGLGLERASAGSSFMVLNARAAGLSVLGLQRTRRSGLVVLGLQRTCRSGLAVLGLQRTCLAGSSFLGLPELALPGSIMHLAAG